MPQMAPLSWLSLMIVFILVLFTFNIINYFCFLDQVKKTDSKTDTLKINWKW